MRKPVLPSLLTSICILSRAQLQAMANLTFFQIILLLLLLFCEDSIAQLNRITQLQSLNDDGKTLVSKEERFELGFFSPGKSKNRYLGIWYKNIPISDTTVWVANRCNPINSSSGKLAVNDDGNIELSGVKGSVILSMNLTKVAKKPKIELLDSGNLVVTEEEDSNSENYLWQSFDYPTDTLLPGMRLGWDMKTGMKWQLIAWRNPDDPCNGELALEIGRGDKNNNDSPELVFHKNNAVFFQSGPWNGLYFSGIPYFQSNSLFNFSVMDRDLEVYFTYNLKNRSTISSIVLNAAKSTLAHLTWIESEQIWGSNFSIPSDACDIYNVCGANANCVISKVPICECLMGFNPKNVEEWDRMDWSNGCVRSISIDCNANRVDGFMKLSGLKLPDTRNSWVDKDTSLRECEGRCFSNCSCTAYSNLDIRGEGSGCVNWFGDIIGIRQNIGGSVGGPDLYVRTADSELVDQTEGREGEEGRNRTVLIVSLVIGGSVFGIVFLFLGCCCICWRKNLKEKNETIRQNESHEELDLPLFTFSQISTATDNFSVRNKLGEGGFGPVYKGELEDGQQIAVKRLSIRSKQGVNEFNNEVKLIAKLQHRNLVKLIGCSIEREEKLLIYEYMPNKSLDLFIFDQTRGILLEWPKRYQILCGIARGLLYLHHDSRLRIVHRDLKTSNVLLDDGMNPKISDFGMARTFGGDQTEGNTNKVVGTFGYMAPEYAFSGQFSTKSDVFSFGVMVLEIVSGKKCKSFKHESHNHTLIGHAWTLLKEERPFDLIDVLLRDSCENRDKVVRCIHVGLLCVQQNLLDRPSMPSVVFMLENDNVILRQPNPPGYFMDSNLQARDELSFTKPESAYSSPNTLTITAIMGR
ncbi:G-type lectin S-receptor-like serine/threonine-protein kinase At4g27290 isoform X2 [Humulus lupulus]|uniref:G-type lectin S-receptor-like serine/threonine-protein kinase At4g27290 isoform X2 n=1 Tax=Humulus lupulus TaxID=3486 RepID=UPI002B403437|nr:G-type lectin S-receptor-like serine/threonine-protein kinase At4g27290 isoform X2 [Humulus lupulus]